MKNPELIIKDVISFMKGKMLTLEEISKLLIQKEKRPDNYEVKKRTDKNCD